MKRVETGKVLTIAAVVAGAYWVVVTAWPLLVSSIASVWHEPQKSFVIVPFSILFLLFWIYPGLFALIFGVRVLRSPKVNVKDIKLACVFALMIVLLIAMRPMVVNTALNDLPEGTALAVVRILGMAVLFPFYILSTRLMMKWKGVWSEGIYAMYRRDIFAGLICMAWYAFSAYAAWFRVRIGPSPVETTSLLDDVFPHTPAMIFIDAVIISFVVVKCMHLARQHSKGRLFEIPVQHSEAPRA